MKKTILILAIAFVFSNSIYSQKSDIDQKKSDNNKIKVNQSATKDSSQSSKINLDESSGNDITVVQTDTDNTPPKKEETGFMAWINNTGNIFTLIISIGTLVGMLFTARKYLKNKNERE
jgi:hypothetical protein